MFPLWATLVMSLLILLFTLAGLSIAVAIWCMLLYRLGADIWDMAFAKLPFTLLSIVVFGFFAYLLGSASFETSAAVIDGLIGRLQ